VTGNADETDFARSALECGAAAPLLGANHPPTSRSRGTTAWQANGHPPRRVNWNEHEWFLGTEHFRHRPASRNYRCERGHERMK
jgi:hypothetical protein